MRKDQPNAPSQIFSHPVAVAEIPEQGVDVSLSADAATRAALAKADRLVGIAMLEADFHVARQGLARFNVTGTVRAKITQTCVLTLEPFDSDLVEEVDVDFAEPSTAVQSDAQAGARAGARVRAQAVIKPVLKPVIMATRSSALQHGPIAIRPIRSKMGQSILARWRLNFSLSALIRIRVSLGLNLRPFPIRRTLRNAPLTFSRS